MNKLIISIVLFLIGTGNLVKILHFSKQIDNDLLQGVEENTSILDVDKGGVYKFEYEVRLDSVASCLECHNDLLENEEVHSPVKKSCERCHISTGAEHPQENISGFTLKGSIPDLCYECHDPKNEEEFLHSPSQNGECVLCHDVHSSPNLYLVKSDPISDICYTCHDLKIPENNLVHGVVSDGACQECHNSHQADNPILLKTSKLGRLCRSCHKSIRNELKEEHLHGPFGDQDCFKCHNGHSSKEAHLSDLKTKELCLSCHEDVLREVNNSNLVHGAMKEEGSCLNCHSAHASSENNILIAKEKEMCMSCHDKNISVESGDIEGLSKQLKEGNNIHAPIEEKGCSACHQPHASNGHLLLKSNFPKEKYVESKAENFELCFECHDKKLIEEPTTETATNFRNKDQNLHYLHIQGNRGRNCNLCHDVHGSKNKYLIKENSQYGNWLMPVDFESTDNGGSCLTGCHKKYDYERKVLIDSTEMNK